MIYLYIKKPQKVAASFNSLATVKGRAENGGSRLLRDGVAERKKRGGEGREREKKGKDEEGEEGMVFDAIPFPVGIHSLAFFLSSFSAKRWHASITRFSGADRLVAHELRFLFPPP